MPMSPLYVNHLFHEGGRMVINIAGLQMQTKANWDSTGREICFMHPIAMPAQQAFTQFLKPWFAIEQGTRFAVLSYSKYTYS